MIGALGTRFGRLAFLGYNVRSSFCTILDGGPSSADLQSNLLRGIQESEVRHPSPLSSCLSSRIEQRSFGPVEQGMDQAALMKGQGARFGVLDGMEVSV